MQELLNALFSLRPEGWLTLLLLMAPLTLYFTVSLLAAARESPWRWTPRTRPNPTRWPRTPSPP
jgi:hypothetical protein